MKKAYQALLDENKISPDVEQSEAVNALNSLGEQLIERSQQQSALVHLERFNKKKAPQIKGLYFHGRVGRGKTMLMDLFYQSLTIERKERIHFHRFMENVHQQLNELKKVDYPLTIIAKSWASKVDLLCFDEFYVNDIGDAMLLAGLLKALFEEHVVLVATSNCEPSQLYTNGLQRERFLPTISLIYQYCQVLSIDGVQDYRLVNYDGHQYYFFPLEKGNLALADYFSSLTKEPVAQIINRLLEYSGNIEQSIEIYHRKIQYIAKTEHIIWFDFFALCSGPRSQLDYIKIADQFSTVFISNVPEFSGGLIPPVFSGIEDCYQRSGVLLGELRKLDDEARRFIALVDEFYDRKIRLAISAEVDIELLYQAKQLKFEFARCQSRLFEMQQW